MLQGVTEAGPIFGGPAGGLVSYFVGWYYGYETCNTLYSNRGSNIG
ncbi:MAG: hypothetical protein RR646_06720 [Erysipelotrichaceae bacterium]